MLKKFSFSTLFTVLLFLILIVSFASAATKLDSAGFNPVPVAVKAQGSSFPVGIVVSWPTATQPDDPQNWLECNGQTITKTAYPELYAKVGATLPDYRGYFMRGVGGKSAAIGEAQAGAIHVDQDLSLVVNAETIDTDVYGAPQFDGSYGQGAYEDVTDTHRVLSVGRTVPGSSWVKPPNAPAPGWHAATGSTTLNAKITSPAGETRPNNKAVRYLIRAKP